MSKARFDILYPIAWWLCVITLPWTIKLNSLCIFFLAVVWIAEGQWNTKWQRLKGTPWIIPLVLFFALHLLGLFYSHNVHTGLSEIEKKITFVAFPLIAASGKPLDRSFFDFLKKSFVYSCAVLIIGSLIYTVFHFTNSSPIGNFGLQTEELFHQLNPSASPLWEHFSYIEVGSWMDLHPAYFSLHISLCVLILLEQILEKNKIRWVPVAGIALFTAFIALLASRMAILSFAIVLVFFIGNHFRKTKWVPGVLIVGCILISLGGLVLLNPVSRFRIIQEPKTTGLQIHQAVTEWNSVNLRLLEWQASWSIIKSSWLAGVGTGDGQDALKNYYSSFNASTTNMDFNSHNQYFQTLIELGMLGLSSLLLCLFLPAFNREYTALYLSFILLFSLMCLTECLLARQKGIVFFTLFQSLFLGSCRMTPPR